MFESFTEEFVDVGAARLFVRHGGSGEPIVLLHGHPRTSATWHRVAPLLMDAGYAVVCPDLRGYGRSSGPDPTSDHAAYSKAAMAADIAALMQEFGHSRFHVVGHDRGSYVAFSLARHHPRRVRRLVLLECIPIVEHLERISAEFATAWWHWFFFAQPEKPERAINADPEAWYRVDPERMGRENFAEWQRAVHDPAVIRAMLEDYRAGLGVDRADEEAARAAGIRISAPLLVLWAMRDDLEELHGDPVAIWRNWADDVRGHAIDSGHHIAEDAPQELADAIIDFLGNDDGAGP